MNETTPTENRNAPSARIMVVDDERSIRATLSGLFESEGIQVLNAAGSDDCLRLLREGFRGVILMDIMMPVRNGWDTIRVMKNEGLLEGNIISMLTAMDIPDQGMNGLQEHVIDYVTKPFESTKLIALVRKHLAILDQIRNRS